MSEHILIIEDEEKIARFVELELNYEGYRTDKAADGRIGLEMAKNGAYDLVLLDIMLPGLNGMEVLRRLRVSSEVPVIMLTARDAVMDKVSGLDNGADDYITKPFAIEELLARIRSALRKARPLSDAADSEHVLEASGIRLDPDRHTVTCQDKPVELTRREFDLLQCLMENRDIVLTRDALLEKVWGYDYAGETNVVDVYIRYLRTKLDEPAGLRLVHTVRGVGYVVKSVADHD
ncbi:MAG: response regulator transcription factor [Clostridiaceae bacterium]|jgi:DNA-binding response OmpR family regulator|nr:response regulator transcription factor [Clostridiaceae bacterium]